MQIKLFSTTFLFQVAYTFDAGPNACLYLLEDDVPEVLSVINYIFPSATDSVEYIRGIPINGTKLSEVNFN